MHVTRRLSLRSHALVLWAGLSVLLGGAVLAAELARSSLDDPVQARQRPGELFPAATSIHAAVVGDDLPQVGHRTVVFFIRDGGYGRLIEALSDGAGERLVDLEPTADIVVVVPHKPTGTPIVTGLARDPIGVLAAAYGMPTPRDGGPPVGYAIVDTQQRIRYATLDPGMTGRLGEVVTLARAAP